MLAVYLACRLAWDTAVLTAVRMNMLLLTVDVIDLKALLFIKRILYENPINSAYRHGQWLCGMWTGRKNGLLL